MKVDKVGNITLNSKGSFSLDGWFFAGPAIVDAENNTIKELENPQKLSVQELLNIDIVENDGVKITKTT